MERIKLLASLALAATVAGCAVHKQDPAPALTGPSSLGTTLTVAVSPDVLTQDGASQALVTITAIDANGQPLRNLSLRAEISVGGAVTDFGRLSAKNVVTDSNGKAVVIYTAPPAPAIVVNGGTVVSIVVTPNGTDANNQITTTSAAIRLVPPGTIGAPPTSLKVDFTPPSSPSVGDQQTFSATVRDASGNDATASVSSYVWNFGDGTTASGQNVLHTFRAAGTYGVTLTITDLLGRTGQAFHSVTVGPGSNPTATVVTSPASPNVNQPVTFTATNVTPAPGHFVTSFAWDFGDGTTGSGQSTTHTYTASGSFTAILTLTDDAGRTGTVTTTVSVGQGAVTAKFTRSPQGSVIVGQTINFNATGSSAQSGRSISSYSWDFGDGTTGSGAQPTHAYGSVGTFLVTLTVTDNAGQTGQATDTISVTSDSPTASFTFSPGTPKPGQPVAFDGTGSTAAPGRTIVGYFWDLGDGRSATGSTASDPGYAAGTYIVKLTVTDNAGRTNTTSKTVTVQ